MRAAIYTRVSSVEQRDQGISLDMQRERCMRAAEAAGADSVVVFEDGGYSGKSTENRPALQDFLGRLTEFDTLYVWKLDRLTRSLRNLLDVLGTLAAAKVDFVSLTEAFDTKSSMGRAALNVAGTFAQLERELIGDRVKEAHRQSTSKGRYLGRVPFGYRRENKLLVTVPEEAEHVRQFFAMYAAGVSINKLCQYATQNAKTTRGGRWWTTTMRTMLTNDTYLGIVRSGGEVVQGLHEAIIDRETWQTVQDRMQDNLTVNSMARESSLSPVLRCGQCGSPVHLHGDAKGWRTYCCRDRLHFPAAERHPAAYPSRIKVDLVIWAFVELLVSEDAIHEAQATAEAARRSGEVTGRRRKLQARHEELTKEIERNLQAYHAGALPLDMLTKLNQGLQAERERAGEAVQALTSPITHLPELTPESFWRMMKGADVEQQRRLLCRLFERVEIWRDKLRFVSRIPGLDPVTVRLPKHHAPHLGHEITAQGLEIID